MEQDRVAESVSTAEAAGSGLDLLDAGVDRLGDGIGGAQHHAVDDAGQVARGSYGRR